MVGAQCSLHTVSLASTVLGSCHRRATVKAWLAMSEEPLVSASGHNSIAVFGAGPVLIILEISCFRLFPVFRFWMHGNCRYGHLKNLDFSSKFEISNFRPDFPLLRSKSLYFEVILWVSDCILGV